MDSFNFGVEKLPPHVDAVLPDKVQFSDPNSDKYFHLCLFLFSQMTMTGEILLILSAFNEKSSRKNS